MAFLYDELNGLRKFGAMAAVPEDITKNLSPDRPLRPYQVTAFENYITWFESPNRPHPIQGLFHMATGSGKTLIMAGLMLYLYGKGYRNFLFFVNLSNIVRKTEENFLAPKSGKYLFAREILLGGRKVPVRQVSNFQDSDPAAINICFTTIQGLHTELWSPREGGLTLDDFEGRKVVLISDEAHHLNADTKRLTAAEESSYHSWESTVRRLFGASRDNVLLEFTATCDLDDPRIRGEYEDKIVFDYPLYKFREDGYSKEIKTLRCDIDRMDRALQAIVLSQYRLKVFQDHRLAVKPVVLFKAATIADSRAFLEAFLDKVSHLTGGELERLSTLTVSETMAKAYRYFREAGITFDQLAQELREDFGEGRCISANDDREAEERQLALNSLEAPDNPYRAVFEVKKLDEGWDVLNLFDIVRLYETRQSGGGRISPKTISEAQLIGRGARYCPFQVEEGQEKFLRKYDHDLNHPLRVCEELYYHCQNDSRYIAELHSALRETGIDLDRTVEQTYRLKEAFKGEKLYREGLVFVNSQLPLAGDAEEGLPPSVREKIYRVSLSTGSAGEDRVLAGESAEGVGESHTCRTTLGEMAGVNYAIVQKALCQEPIFRFDLLRRRFPGLRSTREFVESPAYLGEIQVELTSKYEAPPPTVLYEACRRVAAQVAQGLAGGEEGYRGSEDFRPVYLHQLFGDKRCSYTDPQGGEMGVSQNDMTVDPALRLDLSKEDWFAYEDNYGTGEEKAFVAWFKTWVEPLRQRYEKVYLLRNERQLHLYSFAGGRRFEPDFLLFLGSPQEGGWLWKEVFIEVKGTHLLKEDGWKEDFLLELEERARPVTKFVDNTRYELLGLHFYNREKRDREFAGDLARLCRE